MNKYDEMIESQIDWESEDYCYKQLVRENLETKEKQERMCWQMRKQRYYTDFP